METRSFESKLRMSFDGQFPKLMGLAIPYNKISDNPLPESPQIKEKIAIGAFKQSVLSDDIRLLWQHDPKYVLGRNRAGTLSLKEDENGVSFENVPPDVTWARDLQISIKRNDVAFCSFKFCAKVHYERLSGDSYLQVVDEGRLSEISVVTEPVYLSTSVFSRSAEGVFMVDNKPIEILGGMPDVINPNPQEIKLDDLWKRLEKVNERNGKF